MEELKTVFTEINEANKFDEFKVITKNKNSGIFFKSFFHKPTDLFKDCSKILDEDSAYTIFFNTFCYLLGAKEFNIDKLKSCLEKATREKIAWDMLSGPENETPEDQNVPSPADNPKESEDNEMLQKKAFVSSMINSCELLNKLNQIYLKGLKLRLSKNKISKILIYEAPPFCGTQKIDHFFISKGIYFNVFPETNEYNTNSEDNKEIKEFLKYLMNQEYQIKLSTDLKDALKLTNDKRKNVFYDLTNENIEHIKNSISSCIEQILSTDIVYLDLTLIPIPLNSELRKEWSTNEDYEISIENNQTVSLPVLMFQWAMENLKNELSDNVEDKKCSLFDSNCLIAIGTPLNTSSSIFEYYVDQNYEICKGNITDISRLNSPTAFKKTHFYGTTFPLFKSNVIGGSGWPDRDLVKNAFNLPK